MNEGMGFIAGRSKARANEAIAAARAVGADVDTVTTSINPPGYWATEETVDYFNEHHVETVEEQEAREQAEALDVIPAKEQAPATGEPVQQLDDDKKESTKTPAKKPVARKRSTKPAAKKSAE